MDVKTKHTKEKRIYKWKAGVVLKILKNPIYKGEYDFKGHKIPVPELISKDKWDKLQANLKKNYRNAKHNKRFYLLKGLLYCKRCGHRLFGKIKPSSNERTYCCLSKRSGYDNCGLRSINLDKINKLIWEKSREIALSSERLKEIIKVQKESFFVDTVEIGVQISQLDKSIDNKNSEIKDLLRRRNKYKNVLEEEIDDLISEIKSEKNDLLIRKHELKEKAKKVKRATEKSKHISDYLSIISRNIDSFNDQERYEFLHLLIDRIIVDYDVSKQEHTIEVIYIIPTESTQKNSQESHLQQHSHVGAVSGVGGEGNSKNDNSLESIELRIFEKVPKKR